MAFQRAHEDEPELEAPAARRSHLRLVDPTEAVAAAADEAGAPDAAARGIITGVVISVVAFWGPLIAAIAYLMWR